ncbi:hypothetical protein [Leucobacter luti]|uniref:hypothetical protein n=1 Tax=Leucobacter luti TaxID=340320 RepID=UPI003D00D6D8
MRKHIAYPMTTTQTQGAPPPSSLVGVPVRSGGFLATINAEITKFFTLKTGPITTAVLGVFIVLAALLSSLSLLSPSGNQNPNAEPITSVTELRFVDTVLWMAIVFAVVAVLFATTEFSSGQIQLSFLATPKRVPVVLAKSVVIGVLGLLVGATASTLAMFVAFAVLYTSDVTYEIDLPEVATLAAASGLFMGLIGIISLAFGLLVKNVIAGIAVPVLLFSILPSILESIGNDVVTTIVGYLPSVAGRVVLTTFPNPADLEAWPGMAVLSGWAVVMVALASIVLRRRDA